MATAPTAPLLDPTIQRMLDNIVATGVPPIYTLTPGEAREALAVFQRVPVACMRYQGTIHDFVLINAIAETPTVRAAIAAGAGALRTAFQL